MVWRSVLNMVSSSTSGVSVMLALILKRLSARSTPTPSEIGTPKLPLMEIWLTPAFQTFCTVGANPVADEPVPSVLTRSRVA